MRTRSLRWLWTPPSRYTVTYLRLSGMKLGFLLNFGAILMRDGIHRIVNGLEDVHP